jgi:hypothetical protein
MRTILLVVIIAAVSACVPAPSAAEVTFRGIVTAGPICPVVSEPPDPSCGDRPVAGAEIVIRNEAGEEVARLRSAEDGTFEGALPAGRYQLEPQPVEGLLGTPAPIDLVVADAGEPEVITVSYDTGIR